MQFKDGRSYYENCYLDEIMRRRDSATTKAIWDKHFIPMAEKCGPRKAFTKNRIPLDPQTAATVAAAFSFDPSWKAQAIETTAETVPAITTKATRAAEAYAPPIDVSAETVPPSNVTEPTGDEDPNKAPDAPDQFSTSGKPPVKPEPPAPPPARRRAPAPAPTTTTAAPPAARPIPRARKRGPAPKPAADLAGTYEEPPPHSDNDAPEISSPPPRGAPPPRPETADEAVARTTAKREAAAAAVADRKAVEDAQAAQEAAEGPEVDADGHVTLLAITTKFDETGLGWPDVYGPGSKDAAATRLGITEDYEHWTADMFTAIFAEATGATK